MTTHDESSRHPARPTTRSANATVPKEVNAASRLESAARAGQIHISNTTYELVKDHFATAPVGDLDMKGLAHPIKTHEVLRRDAETGSSFQLEFAPPTSPPKTEKQPKKPSGAPLNKWKATQPTEQNEIGQPTAGMIHHRYESSDRPAATDSSTNTETQHDQPRPNIGRPHAPGSPQRARIAAPNLAFTPARWGAR
jgi:hypothetical protein